MPATDGSSVYLGAWTRLTLTDNRPEHPDIAGVDRTDRSEYLSAPDRHRSAVAKTALR